MVGKMRTQWRVSAFFLWRLECSVTRKGVTQSVTNGIATLEHEERQVC